MSRGGTVERARGRWHEILPLLGIETRFLRNKHGPCPVCGGKDRFRFDDRDGSGSYYCNQCGAGAGLILLRKFRGWDHKTACDAVDEIIRTGPPLHRAAKRRKTIERHGGAKSSVSSPRPITTMWSPPTCGLVGS